MCEALALGGYILHEENHAVAKCDCSHYPTSRIEGLSAEECVSNQHYGKKLEEHDKGGQEGICELHPAFTERKRVKENQETVECARGHADKSSLPSEHDELAIALQLEEPEQQKPE